MIDCVDISVWNVLENPHGTFERFITPHGGEKRN